ncbi:MAG TPA: hypothetical protein VHK01_19000 [Lacipirellulaceae bacterium]|jgi:hypothetical protein|nr:hypothetical protein [Lacipirellulaceae bacterium]
MPDAELVSGLKMVKAKTMHFAFFFKGSDGKLIISQSKISATQLEAAKKEIGGGTLVEGTVTGPLDELVFKVAKPQSPKLAAALKKVVKRDAGITIVPDIQVE